MSIIQQHNADSLSDAWRTINIDALEEDSPLNFDIKTLRPPVPEITEPEVRQLATQVRQLLRAGDNDGALRGCLEMPVYVGADAAKEAALQTVIEVLQSIKASDMSPLLKRLYESDNGSELLDVLMKYLYKGMSSSAVSASSAPRTPTRVQTPQQTGGFSQVGGRPGVGNDSAGGAMSVLLSWHEKVVEVAGLGSIQRTMTDWRRV
ncbi:ARP2/3 complex subunit [Ophiostoma piceae UAMH 11346]|uniref:Actin-related protein 2/3 complex subunit 5 n=1 Tax=Ophiostoma piceae (strain UAMH 11346) TaxID=1262450 RepID=S3BWJ1_OPHP1|nr:ARP2/3 complex subunit [Ophiostoma piceae UAMH 11346]